VNVVLGNGAVFYGNGAHFRGMLAALRGDAEAAGAHLASALAAHEALGAEAWVLHTRAEHAHLLDAAGDTEAAARIGEDVASRCRKLGMIRCAARAERACATGDARAS